MKQTRGWMRWMLCLSVLAAGAAQAQRGAAWSVMSGETVGAGQNVFWGEAGFPGISGEILHGQSPKLDLGARFSFNYGYEGDTSITKPGLKLQGILRPKLLDTGRVRLALHFEPGFFVYFFGNEGFRGNSVTPIGVVFPVGLEVGLPIDSKFTVNFGFDMNFFVQFGSDVQTQLVIPVLFGGGVEYQLDNTLALTFKLRFGPQIYTSSGGTDFSLNALFGLAAKF